MTRNKNDPKKYKQSLIPNENALFKFLYLRIRKHMKNGIKSIDEQMIILHLESINI